MTVNGQGLCPLLSFNILEARNVIKNLATDITVTSKVLIDEAKRYFAYPFTFSTTYILQFSSNDKVLKKSKIVYGSITTLNFFTIPDDMSVSPNLNE